MFFTDFILQSLTAQAKTKNQFAVRAWKIENHGLTPLIFNTLHTKGLNTGYTL